MSATAILFFIVVVLITGFALYLPFLNGNNGHEQRRGNRRNSASLSALEDQLSQSLNAVRDLDLDFDMGKISEADYMMHRKLQIGRGVSAMIRLDDALAHQTDLDHHIEDLIANYRRKRA
jgi:hypothetical protein